MPADHSCFVYDEQAQCRAVAAEFLAEGLRDGQRAAYFGWGDGAELRESFSSLYGSAGGTAPEAVLVASFDGLYRRDVVPAPDDRLEFWAQATEDSLAAGFSALRAVTETTPWLGLVDQRSTFLRSEVLLDRYMLDHPLSVLCVCDRTRLDSDAIDDVVCVHPIAEAMSPPFRMYAMPAGSFALNGEIDTFSAPMLERLLAEVDHTAVGHDLRVDANKLEFVNQQGLRALDCHAARAHLRAVVLRGASAAVERLIEMLDLQHVRSETSR